MNRYGAKNWEVQWALLEQEGNIGLDYVINPTLYPKITAALANHPKSLVVDFGCGTNVMGIQLLFGYQSSVVALNSLKDLNEARFNTLLYIGLEGSNELVKQSNDYLEDLGRPKNIATIQAHIATGLPELFDKSSIDLCVSRNFLMHLSNDDLESHFSYVNRILRNGGLYIISTLNSDYELIKCNNELINGQAYSFPHGMSGEHGTFYHYYRTNEYFENCMQQYFAIEEQSLCMPVTEKFRNTHERYYNFDVPIAKIYVLRVKKRF